MSAANFNLRGLSVKTMDQLKKEAKRLQLSVNALILKMIERGLGVTREKASYTDLDYLAGTWSKREEKEFLKNTKAFEQIDWEQWK